MSHFLLVDDDPAALSGMSRLLRDDGHTVLAFTHAKEALRALLLDSFDVVITDLEMPRVDGQSVLRLARLHQPGACCVVTSVRAAHHFRDLVADGACIVADKPLDYPKLVSLLDECRGRRLTEPHRKAFLACCFANELRWPNRLVSAATRGR